MTASEYKKYYESAEFKQQYLYDGKDLGALCRKDAFQIKLWSPLADQVLLHLYKDGETSECSSFPMQKKEKGVWEYNSSTCGHGLYYDFTLLFGDQEVRSADPWAKASNCNGERSMVVDLSQTNPCGWEEDMERIHDEEQIIYEVHVKDFSYDKASGVPEKYRGKYKAFTLEGTTLDGKGIFPTCLDYLESLGITHVQLMPVYDFGSIDESGSEQEYNWGYDPKNYNVPEGSYATDPYRGEVRIKELKELVLALHKKKIGVIMDVVYNHTYSIDSWFNRTVPHYFYRQYEDGTYSNGSDCGNDVACERKMCRKYILESVLYWAEEYHIDGFRFDLMGLLDVELLNSIRKELDERYGKGKILLYGEPWSASESPMQEGYFPCKKENMHLLDKHIGVFSDGTRDSVKGHVFYEEVPGFVNGGIGLEKQILHAVCAWKDSDETFPVKAPSQIISYLSAHDNLTLWDKLMITMMPGKAFESKEQEVIRAYKMAAAICFTCQGRLFFQAGEEYGRTKFGDENSYKSSPEINQIGWNRTYENREILEYYRGLIAFRKRMSGLIDKSSRASERIFNQKICKDGVVSFGVKNDKNDAFTELFICYNSTKDEYLLTLSDENWMLLADEESSFYWKDPRMVSKEQKVSPVSVSIYGKRK